MKSLFKLKKIILWGALIGYVSYLLFTATQSVVGTISGISGVVDPDLVSGSGYADYLEQTEVDIDGYDLKELKQSIKNDIKWRRKYLESFQKILRKLAENQLVEE